MQQKLLIALIVSLTLNLAFFLSKSVVAQQQQEGSPGTYQVSCADHYCTIINTANATIIKSFYQLGSGGLVHGLEPDQR